MSESQDRIGLRIKWLGCACFEMDFGGVTVVTDPWITPNEKNGVTWEAVEHCDCIALSHGHYDHTLDIPALVKQFDPDVLCGEFTAPALMRWADINPMSVYPMPHGLELDYDAVRIKAVYGRHILLPGTAKERAGWAKNHVINAGDPDLIELAYWGDLEYRNYLYTMANGTRVFVWGSKLSKVDQRNQLRDIRPDVAILQMTVNSAADTAELCAQMGCKVVIPHHFDFPKDHMDLAQELQRELAQRSPGTHCVIPEYNTWIEL